MKLDWKDGDHESYYFYKIETGLIVGQVHKISHTKVWIAKVILKNDEHFVGQYISDTHAKRAVEEYWRIEERTLLE